MSRKNENAERLVYSTESGRVCPGCEQPVAKCNCKKQQAKPKGDGIVRVQRESKGRKGKTVSVITGVPLPQMELADLAKALKARCGTGGTTKNGVIEIQGDHRELLIQELTARGFTAKAAGG